MTTERRSSHHTCNTTSRIAAMIVGTPRSGTTLVQRMVAESCGLPTVPETHMFTVFAPRLLRRRRFPLSGVELRDSVDAYVALKQHRGGAPSTEALMERLDGTAESMTELFLTVVSELASGAEQVVEKTPDHLLWARYLAPALPTTKFIAVTRDPRAVFASTAQVHWGQQNAVMAAERWRRDQLLLTELRNTLPPDRVLSVRYEDLVLDEAATVDRIVDFVDTGALPIDDRNPGIGQDQVFRPHEMEWKRRAAEPVSATRMEAWKDDLSPDIVAKIDTIAGDQMQAFGYERSGSATAKLSVQDRISQARYRARRLAHEQRIRLSYAPRAGLPQSKTRVRTSP